MEVKNLSDLVIYMGAVAGAMLAIGGVTWAVVVRPLKRWISEQISARIQPPLESAVAAAEQVHAEMAPDGGTSLRDAVNRIEAAQALLAARFSDHLTNHPGPGR